jgi:DNA-binding transcriptional regulator YhcF (GntR family)
MLEGPDAAEAAGLLAGNRDANIGPDVSPSGDDFHLGRCAKRFTRDPEIIDAILRTSELNREKYLRPDYLPRTIEKVLYDDPDWLAEQQARRIHPVGKRGVPVRHRVKQAIIDYCQDQQPGVDGFIALPVNEIAWNQAVSFDTVTRATNDLEQAGMIVTKVERQRTKTGGWRCTRWVMRTASEHVPNAVTEGSLRPRHV